MLINSIMFHNSDWTSTDADCEGFSMHMGHCSSETLSPESFDGNYIAGTKTLVYDTPLLTVDMDDEWAQIVLEQPFQYNGTDNLIIEIQWDNGTEDNSYYTHHWPAGDNRCIYQQDSPGINSFDQLPHMIIAGEGQSMENSTFAGIKVEIGR